MRLLTLARDLRRRKSRERQALFVAEGVRSVDELIRSPLEVMGVLLAPQLDTAPKGAELRARIGDLGIPADTVSEAEFRSAAETESPQGVLAIGAIPARSLGELAGRSSLRLLVLDAVQDPGNVGTIVRTAAALGVDATIALPGTVDLWNAKVVRGAMGAVFHHRALHASASQLFAFLDAEDVQLWVADTGGEPVGEVRPPEKLALAVGNEGGGLSSFIRERATGTVSVPISGSVTSLNVAVATGVLLYQLRT